MRIEDLEGHYGICAVRWVDNNGFIYKREQISDELEYRKHLSDERILEIYQPMVEKKMELLATDVLYDHLQTVLPTDEENFSYQSVDYHCIDNIPDELLAELQIVLNKLPVYEFIIKKEKKAE